MRHTPLPGPTAKKTKALGAKAASLICKSLLLFVSLQGYADLSLEPGQAAHQFFTDNLKDQRGTDLTSVLQLRSNVWIGEMQCP